MRLRTGVICGWMAVAGVTATAAEYWNEKDFLEWSPREVERMLNDSPWSRPVTVTLGSPPGSGSRRVGADGGPAQTGGFRPVPDAESSRGRGRQDGFVPVQRLSLTVSWRSALPVKQALVRRQLGDRLVLPLPFGQWSFLVQFEPLYVVSVSGLPDHYVALAGDLEALRTSAALERRGTSPVPAQDVQVFRERAGGVIVEYAFLRSDPIELADEHVEFVATLNRLEVKRRFTLAEMLVDGQLVL